MTPAHWDRGVLHAEIYKIQLDLYDLNSLQRQMKGHKHVYFLDRFSSNINRMEECDPWHHFSPIVNLWDLQRLLTTWNIHTKANYKAFHHRPTCSFGGNSDLRLLDCQNYPSVRFSAKCHLQQGINANAFETWASGPNCTFTVENEVH
jgi:hypothetical protein